MLKTIISEIPKTFAFVERNVNLVRRYFAWEVVFMSYSIVNALTIAFIGVTEGKEQVLYLVVGALLWGFLSVLFHEVAEAVAYERWEDTIEFTFAAPIRRLTYLFGNSLFAAMYGLARSIILLIVVIFIFQLEIEQANFLGAALVLFASSLSFIGLGLVAAILPLISLERGAQATHIFQALLLLVSGVYYDVSVLPGWLQPLSKISPATYTLRAMRAALMDGASCAELLPQILLLIAIGAVLIPLGYVTFSIGEHYAKIHGKLKRGG
ncbi:MAG: ABC transporter permease [Candidatus Zixiibacteriota bacterium]